MALMAQHSPDSPRKPKENKPEVNPLPPVLRPQEQADGWQRALAQDRLAPKE